MCSCMKIKEIYTGRLQEQKETMIQEKGDIFTKLSNLYALLMFLSVIFFFLFFLQRHNVSHKWKSQGNEEKVRETSSFLSVLKTPTQSNRKPMIRRVKSVKYGIKRD